MIACSDIYPKFNFLCYEKSLIELLNEMRLADPVLGNIYDFNKIKFIEDLVLRRNGVVSFIIISTLVSEDATIRYLSFIEQFPGLLNRIPLSHAASYLGGTQQSLSRIRKNIR